MAAGNVQLEQLVHDRQRVGAIAFAEPHADAFKLGHERSEPPSVGAFRQQAVDSANVAVILVLWDAGHSDRVPLLAEHARDRQLLRVVRRRRAGPCRRSQ